MTTTPHRCDDVAKRDAILRAFDSVQGARGEHLGACALAQPVWERQFVGGIEDLEPPLAKVEPQDRRIL
jgi:hypothetical protein